MYKLIALFELFRDIWTVVGIRYALYLMVMIIAGVIEGVSLASVAPLLSAVGVGQSQVEVSAGMAGLAKKILEAVGVAPNLYAMVAFVLVALLISTILFLVQAFLGGRLQTNYVYEWQQRLITAIFSAKLTYIQQRRHGDIVNAIVSETQRLGGAFYQLGLLLTGMVHGLIFLMIAASLSPSITMVVLVGGATLFLISRPLLHRAYRIGMGISESNADFQTLTTDLVFGAKLVKATATERQAILRLLGVANKLRSYIFNNSFDIQIAKGIFDFGAAAMVAGIIFISHDLLKVDSAITLVILAIFVRLMPKLSGIQQSLQAISLSLPAVQVVNEIACSAEVAAETALESVLPAPLSKGSFSIHMQEVSVHHGDRLALKHINLSVSKGECIAVVGGSGAGKSTLVDAMLGLVPVSNGCIEINNHSLLDLPLDSLRRRVGYMAQESVLFHGTVRENILWGQVDEFSEEMTSIAAEKAAAIEVIKRLPAGFDTPIGNRGSALSGGERQRLGLARALAGSPALLILDEATSALDAETEAIVVSALREIKGQVTIIMIAHRLSSISMADQIYVMDRGSIVESGTWEELIAQDGSFNNLWKLQTKINGSEL